MLEGGLEGEYTIIVHGRAGGGYHTEVPELLGCGAEAETVNEVIERTKDAIRTSLAQGGLPLGEDDISFRLMLRIDRYA